MIRPFHSYADYLRQTFGAPIRKISIDTNSSCPNRDGTKGTGGCSYCNIDSIRPSYAKTVTTIQEQIEKGISFFQHRGEANGYLAYFQTYSNTHKSIQRFQEECEQALACDGIVGIVVATRPDCIDDHIVNCLQALQRRTYISVELGVESTDDATLLRINRCHTFEDSVAAIDLLARNGIPVGAHVILGFPWENRDTLLSHAKNLANLPLTFLKLHHLQILRYTALAREYRSNKFSLLSPMEYLDIVIRFIELSNPNIVFQRLIAECPHKLLIAPDWNGIRNYQFTEQVRKEMSRRGTYQGRDYLHSPHPTFVTPVQ